LLAEGSALNLGFKNVFKHSEMPDKKGYLDRVNYFNFFIKFFNMAE